jgi:hypothetical protein
MSVPICIASEAVILTLSVAEGEEPALSLPKGPLYLVFVLSFSGKIHLL